MSAKEKAKRYPNFETIEVDILLDLCEREKRIIENTRTDAVTSKDKKDAWSRIETDFNKVSAINYRPAANLQAKYKNLKGDTKKKLAQEKLEVKETGGGSSKWISHPMTTVENRVAALLGNRATGLEAIHDSDASMHEDYCEEYEVDVYADGSTTIVPSASAEKPSGSSKYNAQWEKYSAAMLRNKDRATALTTPISPALLAPVSQETAMKNYMNVVQSGDDESDQDCVQDPASKTGSKVNNSNNLTKKHQAYQDKVSAWAAGRASLIDLQKQAFMDRNKQDMKHAQEVHEKKLAMELEILKVRKLDYENQAKANEKKSELEIEILTLQRDKLLREDVMNRIGRN